MINAVNLLRRRPDLAVDAFQEHWRTRHADLILKLPGVVRYVQSHPLPEMYRDGQPAYDGIAELWASHSQAFRDIGVSEAYLAVQGDEEKFLDRTAIALILTEEHVMKDGAVSADGIKCIGLFKRKPNMPVDEFQTYWREKYGPQLATLPSLDRYAQYHARLGAYSKGREPAYDGLDVTWFKSVDIFRDAMRSGEYESSCKQRTNFLNTDDCRRILTRELVIGGVS